MASKKLLNTTVCVFGPGYVGLPLAQDFSAHIRTIGYRRDQKKVDELNTTPGNKIEATTDPAGSKGWDVLPEIVIIIRLFFSNFKSKTDTLTTARPA